MHYALDRKPKLIATHLHQFHIFTIIIIAQENHLCKAAIVDLN